MGLHSTAGSLQSLCWASAALSGMTSAFLTSSKAGMLFSRVENDTLQSGHGVGLQSTAGSLQSLCWASAALGGVASAYFSGSLLETWGPRGVFLLTAAFPLVVSAAAVLINEQPISGGGSRLKADKDTASKAAPSFPFLSEVGPPSPSVCTSLIILPLAGSWECYKANQQGSKCAQL